MRPEKAFDVRSLIYGTWEYEEMMNNEIDDTLRHERLLMRCREILNMLEESIDDVSNLSYNMINGIDYERYNVMDITTSAEIVKSQPTYNSSFSFLDRIYNSIVSYIIHRYADDEDHYDIVLIDDYYCSIDDLINAPSYYVLVQDTISILSQGGFNWERFRDIAEEYSMDDPERGFERSSQAKPFADDLSQKQLAEYIVDTLLEDVSEYITANGIPKIYN